MVPSGKGGFLPTSIIIQSAGQLGLLWPSRRLYPILAIPICSRCVQTGTWPAYVPVLCWNSIPTLFFDCIPNGPERRIPEPPRIGIPVFRITARTSRAKSSASESEVGSPQSYVVTQTVPTFGASASKSTKYFCCSKLSSRGPIFRSVLASCILVLLSSISTICCAAFASDAALSSFTILADCRPLIMLPVINAISPNTKVKATKPTDAHCDSEFHPSTLQSKTFILFCAFCASLVIVSFVIFSVVWWRLNFSSITRSLSHTD